MILRWYSGSSVRYCRKRQMSFSTQLYPSGTTIKGKSTVSRIWERLIWPSQSPSYLILRCVAWVFGRSCVECARCCPVCWRVVPASPPSRPRACDQCTGQSIPLCKGHTNLGRKVSDQRKNGALTFWNWATLKLPTSKRRGNFSATYFLHTLEYSSTRKWNTREGEMPASWTYRNFSLASSKLSAT